MINQTNVPIMQKAVQVIYDMSEDTRVREITRLREKAMRDEASLLHHSSDTLVNSLCELQGHQKFNVRLEESLSGNQ